MSPRKSGLGRGLGALIPLAEEPEGGVLQVAWEKIHPNPHQPRSLIRDQDLVELAASIQEHGIIQPLVVARDGDEYSLIAGERRWRAARLAGLTTVPVVVKDAAPQQMLELALVENIQRQDLNPLEEAAAYQHLAQDFGLTHEDIARRVGRSRAAVSNTLRLLKASPPVREALAANKISEGHARALLRLEQQAQVGTLRLVLRRGLSVRQTEELVQRLLDGAAARSAAPPPPPEVQAVEAHLRQVLGTKVRLLRGKKGGRLVIYYYSDEELEQIYERIAQTQP